MKVRHDSRTIRNWMKKHVGEHTDVRTGEVNMTSLVEAWDIENGRPVGETLDTDHVAWDIASEFV